ncbi:MAG: hypothetical protein ABI351_09995 [Herbaspirillum sp.]
MKINSYKTCTAAAIVCAFSAPIFATAASAKDLATETYVAKLQPMNAVSTHHETTGTAKFEVHGDKLTITVNVKDAAPNTIHWQHFHGFKTDAAAECANQAADTNSDGFVDLIETGPASGTTMVPFDDKPAAMDVAHGAYPKADIHGNYKYRKVVSLKALTAAFSKAFDGQKLDLDKRVLIIHGVPADTKLPATVQSLGPIPAQVTLPIACGKIERVNR